MLLRKARRTDIDALFAVREAVTENRLHEPIEEFRKLAAPVIAAGLCWLCEAGDGRVLGFSACEPATGAIEVLYVRPDAEGRGIGRALLRKSCDDLLLRGHGHAWLTTTAGTRAEGFYRKLGWRSFPSKTPTEVLFRRGLLR